jgi:hypothetical protein
MTLNVILKPSLLPSLPPEIEHTNLLSDHYTNESIHNHSTKLLNSEVRKSDFIPAPSELSGEQAKNARSMQLWIAPKSSSSVGLTEEILGMVLTWEANTGSRKRLRSASKASDFLDCIASIIGSLLRAWGGDNPIPLFRTLDNAAFTGYSLKARLFKTALKELLSLGLVNHVPGEWCSDQSKRAGLYWPSQKLLELASIHGLDTTNVRSCFGFLTGAKAPLPERPLRLRKLKEYWQKRPEEMAFSADDPVAIELSTEIEAHHRLAQVTSVGGCPPPRWYRGFTYDWAHHGRWYALGMDNYQQSDEEERLREITIGGEHVAELDISGSLLTLLYGQAGLIPPGGDPYLVNGIPREVVKAWVTAAIGKASPPTQWSRKKLPDDHLALTYDPVVAGEAILAKHPVLREPVLQLPTEADPSLGHRLLPHRLMFVEARIISRVMQELREEGILSLPMHDGLIVPRSAVPFARNALLRVGRRIGKVGLRLKVSRHGQESEVITE